MWDSIACFILALIAFFLGIGLILPLVLLICFFRMSKKIDGLSEKIDRIVSKTIPPPAPQQPAQPPAQHPVQVPPPPVTRSAASPLKPVPPSPEIWKDFKPYEPPAPDPDSLQARTERLLGRVWNWICVGEEFRPKDVSAEYAVATAWLVRAGAVVLLFGIGFFLKYSFEHNWVSPVVRVSGMGVTGLTLAGLGYWLSKEKFRPFGIGLLGIGAVTLYLSILAGYRLYGLFSVETTFALMCVVTACAMTAAVSVNALFPALIVCAGGYLTPLFLSTGQRDFIFLLGYYAILTAGMLYAAKRKQWILVSGASFLLYGVISLGASADGFFTRANYPLCAALIVLNYLLFQWQGHLRPEGKKSVLPELLVLAANPVLFLLLTVPVAYQYGYEAFRLPAMFSFFAAAVSYGSHVRSRKRADTALAGFDAVLAAVFLAVTVPLLLRNVWIDAAWSCLALGFAFLSAKTKFKALSVLADVLFALTLLCLLAKMPGGGKPYLEGLTDRMLSVWVFLACLALGGRHRWYRAAVAGVLFFLYSSGEIYKALTVYQSGFRNGGVSVWWGLLGFAALFCGLRRTVKELRVTAAVLFVLCVFKIFLIDLEHLPPIWRITAFLVLGVLLLVSALLYMRFKGKFTAPPDQENTR